MEIKCYFFGRCHWMRDEDQLLTDARTEGSNSLWQVIRTGMGSLIHFPFRVIFDGGSEGGRVVNFSVAPYFFFLR